MLRFDGRVAIVTGGARGLGRAYADLLAQRGAAVVINDLGGPVDGGPGRSDAAEQAAGEIRRAGGRACANGDSVATETGARAIVDTALEHYGRLDVVINNAGIVNAAPFASMPADQFCALLAVHVGGSVLVSKAAWPHLARQGYGRIVLTTSLGGVIGALHQMAHYATAKGAIVGLTHALAAEGEQAGISVNAISPSAATRQSVDQLDPKFAAWFDTHLKPEYVAPVAAWLVHEDCRENGQIYSAGGGYASKIFIGETAGFRSACLSIEQVRDHLDEIRNEAGYLTPTRHNRFEIMQDRLAADPEEAPRTSPGTSG